VTREGVEHVGDSCNLALDRDLLARDPVWIAGTVEPLMVRQGDGGGDIEHLEA